MPSSCNGVQRRGFAGDCTQRVKYFLVKRCASCRCVSNDLWNDHARRGPLSCWPPQRLTEHVVPGDDAQKSFSARPFTRQQKIRWGDGWTHQLCQVLCQLLGLDRKVSHARVAAVKKAAKRRSRDADRSHRRQIQCESSNSVRCTALSERIE